jgi:hypothetical protein
MQWCVWVEYSLDILIGFGLMGEAIYPAIKS